MLFQRVQPGGQISASDFNRLLEEIERVMFNVVAEPPLQVDRNDAGLIFRLNQPRETWVRITGLLPAGSGSGSGSGDGSGSGAGSGSGSGPSAPCLPGYTGVIQAGEDGGCQTDSTADTPLDATLPAYEVNGRSDVPTDGSVVVRVWQEPGQAYYLFYYGATSGGFGYITGLPFCPSEDWETPCPSGSGSGSSGSGGHVYRDPDPLTVCTFDDGHWVEVLSNGQVIACCPSTLPYWDSAGGDCQSGCPGGYDLNTTTQQCCQGGYGFSYVLNGVTYCCPSAPIDLSNPQTCVRATPPIGSNPCGQAGSGSGGGTGEYVLPCCPADYYPAVLVTADPSRQCPNAPTQRIWLEEVNGRRVPPGELVRVELRHPAVSVNGDTRPLYGTTDGVGNRCTGCNADGHLCSGGGVADCHCGQHYSTRCGRCVDDNAPACPPEEPNRGPCGDCQPPCLGDTAWIGDPCWGCFPPCPVNYIRVGCGCVQVHPFDPSECPAGQHYDAPSGACVDDDCPPGASWNGATGRCESDPIGGGGL